MLPSASRSCFTLIPQWRHYFLQMLFFLFSSEHFFCSKEFNAKKIFKMQSSCECCTRCPWLEPFCAAGVKKHESPAAPTFFLLYVCLFLSLINSGALLLSRRSFVQTLTENHSHESRWTTKRLLEFETGAPQTLSNESSLKEKPFYWRHERGLWKRAWI